MNTITHCIFLHSNLYSYQKVTQYILAVYLDNDHTSSFVTFSYNNVTFLINVLVKLSHKILKIFCGIIFIHIKSYSTYFSPCSNFDTFLSKKIFFHYFTCLFTNEILKDKSIFHPSIVSYFYSNYFTF